MRMHWRKLIVTCEWLSVEDSFWVRNGCLCALHSEQGCHLVETCIDIVPAARIPVCSFLHVSVMLCLEGLALCCPLSPLSLTIFLPILLYVSLSPNGRDLMKMSHLRLTAPRFLILCSLPICCRRKLWRWLSLALIYEYHRMSLGVILMLHSFSRTEVFVFS